MREYHLFTVQTGTVTEPEIIILGYYAMLAKYASDDGLAWIMLKLLELPKGGAP